MSMRSFACFVLITSFLVTASIAAAQEDVGSVNAAVIYGQDDRHEWYEELDPDIRELTRRSSIAFVPRSSIDLANPGSYWPPFTEGLSTLANDVESSRGLPLCDGVAYANQPTVARCSGTLVAPNLVLTAGHCFTPQRPCEAYLVVFDFLYEDGQQQASIDPEDIYECKRIVAQVATKEPHLDYAFIELDRDVVGREPVTMRTSSHELDVGTELVVAGYGFGLPMKIDAGGFVTTPLAPSGNTFVTNTDTFVGNSGSGVFDREGLLVGVLVSGQIDLVQSTETSVPCLIENTLPETPGGELATYSHRALRGLCASDYEGHLCPDDESGCSCSAAGLSNKKPSPGLLSLAALLLLVAVQRKRRSCAP